MINIFFIILTIIQEPYKILHLFLFLSSGVPVYFIAIAGKRKVPIIKKILGILID